jgi:RNA polymerase sigma-70 factor (ECF subfamily)
MFQRFQRVGRWEEIDDVLQNAVLRLLQWKPAAPLANTADFFRMMTRIIRNELIDLARRYYGPQGLGTRHDTGTPPPAGEAPPQALDVADSTNEPGRIVLWTEFHGCVEALPDEERDVFGLRWYVGLTHTEVAAALGVAEITVRRRWLRARLLLQKSLGDDGPFR